MKQEQGVVVSDASELLFEDIKKLNAQQRPDVPTCLIYAPISLLPMSTKAYFYLLKLAHSKQWQRAASSPRPRSGQEQTLCTASTDSVSLSTKSSLDLSAAHSKSTHPCRFVHKRAQVSIHATYSSAHGLLLWLCAITNSILPGLCLPLTGGRDPWTKICSVQLKNMQLSAPVCVLVCVCGGDQGNKEC